MIGEPAQHFVSDPHWAWYIVFYFFFAGIAGGSYAISTLLRWRGNAADEPAARVGYYLALPPVLVAPILLILDLGQPLRFWHMIISTTPDSGPFMFKVWAPMSVGVYGLLAFTFFAAVSFVHALALDGVLRIRLATQLTRWLEGNRGLMFHAVGAVLGLFIAGYTGVLLSVSNQPVWSDTWVLGALFLASGLTISAALIQFFGYYRADTQPSAGILTVFERLFAGLEVVMILVFAFTVVAAGTASIVFGGPWALLWFVVFLGTAPGVIALFTRGLNPPAHPEWWDLRPARVPIESSTPSVEDPAATADEADRAEGARDAPGTDDSGESAAPATATATSTRTEPETRRAPLSAWLPPWRAALFPAMVVIAVFSLRVAVIISIH